MVQRRDDAARRRAHATAAACVSIALLLLLGPSTTPALAGTYVMRNCDVPGHPSALIGPWQMLETTPSASLVDACATGGGVGFALSGPVPAGQRAMLGLARPQDGAQSAIKLVKAVLWFAARLSGSGSPIHIYSLESHSDGTSYPSVSYGPPGDENLLLEQDFSPVLTDLFKFGFACGVNNPSGPSCIAASGMPLQIKGMEVTLSEDVPPTVSPPAGTLLGDGPQRGVRTVSYSASDPQSGLAKVDVLLGDTVVASRDLTAQCSYHDFSVCPGADAASLDVDTRNVPNGSHRLTLRVQDAAGNQQSVSAPDPIQIDNAGGSSSQATGSGGLRLTARLVGSSRPTLVVPDSRRVRVRGRLQRASKGVGRASIEIFERPAGDGTHEVAVGTARTRSDGSFSYLLAAHRPSRRVRLAYRPAGAAQPVSSVLKLRVRAAASLRVTLRGVTVRFSGRVLGHPLPQNGKRVLLQGRAPGFAWASFATLRADRHGRFAGRYRLPIRRPGVRLQIRVIVPAEEAYPYLRYSGSPATVVVH